jgi:hypothetical protein
MRIYPAYKGHIFAKTITKDQLTTIKDMIKELGYEQTSGEDEYYQGAFVTDYSKKISGPGLKEFEVAILISFKRDTPETDQYRNMGFVISNFEDAGVPEVEEEINKVEQIVLDKLIEFSGKENIEMR